MVPDSSQRFRRYQDLQRYVGWTDEDRRRIQAAGPLLHPFFKELVDDFYQEIDRHEEARRVITGGPEQVNRLKQMLMQWLCELLSGEYDERYVEQRWRVGMRHVEIGLNQVYANAALSRLRSGLLGGLESAWQGDLLELLATRKSLNVLIDLDLAIIEDAYQSVYLERQQRIDRLVAIGQMAGGVAHELRNPLNVIKTSVYYLLNARNASPEKVAEHLGRIERQVGLADKVITALSDFAKLPLPQVRAIPLAQCLDEALEISNLPGEIHCRIDVPADLPSMLADPDQMRLVFANLIRNARDAMPQGGEISISAKGIDSVIEVAVQDQGVGIPPEIAARIMEPLFSTKPRGLGLGLALAKSILDKHQGNMQVVSQPEKGTIFTIRLPAASIAEA